jgi:glutamine synthetase
MNVHRGALSDEYGASRIDAAEFAAFLQENPQIQYVDCVFADLCGIVRGKRVARAELEGVFRDGLKIPSTIYFLDARGDVAGRLGRIDDGDATGTAWPVAGTLSRVNWSQRPHGQVLMTLADAKGSPYFGEPRNVLRRVVERFADLDLVPVVASQFDFYLVDRERTKAGVPQPPAGDKDGRDARSLLDAADVSDALASIAEAALTQNLPAIELAQLLQSGQTSVGLTHVEDAIRAGDNAVFLRQVVRAVARQHGLDATFMAKPYLGVAGNGMRWRVSLKHSSGKNVFDDGSATGSELALFALGGLQALMAESMALFAPHVNAYRRFAAEPAVARNKRWGHDNPSTNLRVPGPAGKTRRIEHGLAGADANPYLVLAAVLAGVHHGITQQIDPGQPFEGNAATLVDETIPSGIDAALVALENGSIMPEYLGRSYVDLYCATKRTELERFRDHIPAHEYDWYL